jgi:hypothetical protein
MPNENKLSHGERKRPSNGFIVWLGLLPTDTHFASK